MFSTLSTDLQLGPPGRLRAILLAWDPGLRQRGWADQRVTAVRDDPAGRLALVQRCYYGLPAWHAPAACTQRLN